MNTLHVTDAELKLIREGLLQLRTKSGDCARHYDKLIGERPDCAKALGGIRSLHLTTAYDCLSLWHRLPQV